MAHGSMKCSVESLVEVSDSAGWRSYLWKLTFWLGQDLFRGRGRGAKMVCKVSSSANRHCSDISQAKE